MTNSQHRVALVVSIVLLGAGGALLLAAAALAYQAGIIADATGAVGSLRPVDAAILVVGGLATAGGIATMLMRALILRSGPSRQPGPEARSTSAAG